MTDLCADIRTHIAGIKAGIEELRRSAKRHIDNPQKVREISIELRAHMERLESLKNNLIKAAPALPLLAMI